MVFSRKQVSIRTVLLVLLIGEILAIVGVTWWLWYRNGQKAVKVVEVQLRNELTVRIHQHILQFLSLPDRINQMNEDAFSLGRLDLGNVEELAPYLWRQLKTFPSISYIEVGTETDDFIGVERLADGNINLELKNEGTEGAMFTFSLDENGRRGQKKIRPHFHTRGRPWYRAAMEAGEPTWTGIYPFFSLPVRLGLTAVRPIRDEDGQVVGVLGSDLVLTHISQFLQTLKVGETGCTFILETNGLLVANSSPDPPVRSSGDQLERIPAREFGNPLIRAASEYLEQTYTRLDAIRESRQLVFDWEGERILMQVGPVRHPLGIDWLSVVVVPEADFMGAIHANTRTTLVLFLVLLIVAGVTVAITTRKITQSILHLNAEMVQIADFNVSDEEPESSSLLEIRTMQTSMAAMKKALRSFGKYVPTDVVRQLIRAKREAILGVEPAEVTIFFSDIANFTTISESISHEVLVQLMGEYLDALSQIILRAGGTVDKYIGDAIMAFWNAPLPMKDHHRAAVSAALDCQTQLALLHGKWEAKGQPHLPTRIGLHTGSVLVGNLGSHLRMNYTVIGDSVNLASRIEGLNKVYGTQVLITDTVHRHLGEAFLCRPIDIVVVKGKVESTRIYEPIAAAAEATAEQRELVTLYGEALSQYEGHAFGEGRGGFERYLERVPGDGAAACLRARCADYESDPPPPGWNGAFRFHQK